MTSAQPSYPGLPVVPHPAAGELLGSWLLRVAQFYGLGLHDLLVCLDVMSLSTRISPFWCELHLGHLRTDQLAVAMHRSAESIAAMAAKVRSALALRCRLLRAVFGRSVCGRNPVSLASALDASIGVGVRDASLVAQPRSHSSAARAPQGRRTCGVAAQGNATISARTTAGISADRRRVVARGLRHTTAPASAALGEDRRDPARQDLAQLDPSPDVTGSGRRGSASVGALAQRSSRTPRALGLRNVSRRW